MTYKVKMNYMPSFSCTRQTGQDMEGLSKKNKMTYWKEKIHSQRQLRTHAEY